jgi:hypothetical protein
MVTQRRQSDTWIGRVANEVYVGALVVGAVTVLGGIIAALVALALQLNNWVAMAD